MAEVSIWVTSPERNYTQAAKDQFLRMTDYFLVAQAKSGSHDVVTFELSAPNTKNRILIPNACAALGIRCREPFSVYHTLGLRFLGTVA